MRGGGVRAGFQLCTNTDGRTGTIMNVMVPIDQRECSLIRTHTHTHTHTHTYTHTDGSEAHANMLASIAQMQEALAKEQMRLSHVMT